MSDELYQALVDCLHSVRSPNGMKNIVDLQSARSLAGAVVDLVNRGMGYTAADLQRARIEAATAQREADANICETMLNARYTRDGDVTVPNYNHPVKAIRTAPLADGMQEELEKLLEERERVAYQRCAQKLNEISYLSYRITEDVRIFEQWAARTQQR